MFPWNDYEDANNGDESHTYIKISNHVYCWMEYICLTWSITLWRKNSKFLLCRFNNYQTNWYMLINLDSFLTVHGIYITWFHPKYIFWDIISTSPKFDIVTFGQWDANVNILSCKMQHKNCKTLGTQKLLYF